MTARRILPLLASLTLFAGCARREQIEVQFTPIDPAKTETMAQTHKVTRDDRTFVFTSAFLAHDAELEGSNSLALSVSNLPAGWGMASELQTMDGRVLMTMSMIRGTQGMMEAVTAVSWQRRSATTGMVTDKWRMDSNTTGQIRPVLRISNR